MNDVRAVSAIRRAEHETKPRPPDPDTLLVMVDRPSAVGRVMRASCPIHAQRFEQARLLATSDPCWRREIHDGVVYVARHAERELVAAGQRVRKRSVETRSELTAREARIARLARDGLSNPEIGGPVCSSPAHG